MHFMSSVLFFFEQTMILTGCILDVWLGSNYSYFHAFVFVFNGHALPVSIPKFAESNKDVLIFRIFYSLSFFSPLIRRKRGKDAR